MVCMDSYATITLSEINLPGIKVLCVGEMRGGIMDLRLFAKTLDMILCCTLQWLVGLNYDTLVSFVIFGIKAIKVSFKSIV